MKIEFLKNNFEMIDEMAELFYKEWSYLVPERSISDFKRTIQERVNTNKIPLETFAW